WRVEGPPRIDDAARVLDLDDLGAEGRGEMGGEGFGDERPGGKDIHPLQGTEGLGKESARGGHTRPSSMERGDPFCPEIGRDTSHSRTVVDETVRGRVPGRRHDNPGKVASP